MASGTSWLVLQGRQARCSLPVCSRAWTASTVLAAKPLIKSCRRVCTAQLSACEQRHSLCSLPGPVLSLSLLRFLPSSALFPVTPRSSSDTLRSFHGAPFYHRAFAGAVLPPGRACWPPARHHFSLLCTLDISSLDTQPSLPDPTMLTSNLPR